jgi:hypothetical protein
MSSVFVTLAVLAPCFIAIFLSRIAQSPITRRILSWGGAFYVLVIALVVFHAEFFGHHCVGGMVKGYSSCEPDFLLSIASTSAAPLLLAWASYLLVGPLLLCVAAVFESLRRRRTR